MRVEKRTSDGDWRSLVGLLAAAEDAERKRLAEALHDDTLQLLAVANVELGTLRHVELEPGVLRRVARAEEMIRRASESLRLLVFDLYPPDLERHGLLAALEELTAQVFADDTFIELASDLEREIGASVIAAAFRIVQEALANVRRHAKASRVTIHLAHDGDDLVVTVRDDGVGFDATDVTMRAGHLGLRSMRERAESREGSLDVYRAVPSGTIVSLRLPDAAEP
jgi:signal transduction histidine kinase